ncbi:hypothetical protein EDD15DRAFT_2201002 [Pisolithus albus]|nr:hypothetical protein EDD15DRAFT_2201002 [Pisolithus albus]
MPRICKECGLEFDNKILHDTHWKKCVREVTFIAYTGQEITLTRQENGAFACYCSHPKCPKQAGFATMDTLHKHMKTLKTTWLGPEKKAGGQSSVQAGGTTSPMEITTNVAPKMPAIPQDETMKSPSHLIILPGPQGPCGWKRLSHGSVSWKRLWHDMAPDRALDHGSVATAMEASPYMDGSVFTATEASPYRDGSVSQPRKHLHIWAEKHSHSGSVSPAQSVDELRQAV